VVRRDVRDQASLVYLGQQERSPYLLIRGSIFKTMLSIGTPRIAQEDQEIWEESVHGLVDWYEEDGS
jgi:hypothetical protein